METSDTFKRPKLRSEFRLRLWRLSQRWPLFVWILLILLTFWLYTRSTRYGPMIGVVEKFTTPVAPLEPSKLISLNVRVGERVKAGQILATLDTSQLDADLLIEEAQMADLVAGYQQNILQIVREFESNFHDAKSALELERLNETRDKAELEALHADLERRRELHARRLISDLDLHELTPDIAALEHAVSNYPSLIGAMEARLDRARKTQQELRHWLQLNETDDMLTVMDRVTREGNRNMAIVRSAGDYQRQMYLLRATDEGIVSQIYYQPGATVDPGLGIPILELISSRPPTNIVGYMTENWMHVLTVDRKLLVIRQDGRALPSLATVKYISPIVEAMPTRLGPLQNPDIEFRGRRFMLSIPADSGVIPGETVKLRIADDPLKALIKRIRLRGFWRSS